MRVTLKLATSLDGRIATATGESRWITGEAAREQGHRLRAAHDAVLVGVQTVLADDPQLTVRLPGRPVDQPLRVVLDGRLRTPETAKLAGEGTLILTTAEPRPVGGALVERVAGAGDGRAAVDGILNALKRHGIGSVLIEGGGQVAASFIAALTSSTVTLRLVITVRSTTLPVETGTRKEIPVSLPFSSGITKPTAFAAPVVLGMMFIAAARARYGSAWGRSCTR